MTTRSTSLAVASVLWTGLFAFAFVAASASCAWGLSAYVGAGLGVLLTLAALPFVLPAGYSMPSRLLAALVFGLVGLVVWIAGFFIADIRIICRLF
jgi:hypothetical protein